MYKFHHCFLRSHINNPSNLFIFVLSIPLCYFKIQQLYTVKHNTSNVDENTPHRRHVSAHIAATTTSRSTRRSINTPHCHHPNVPHNANRKSSKPSEHQILRFHVIPRLATTDIFTTTFNPLTPEFYFKF
jgi:hypothetical protein